MLACLSDCIGYYEKLNYGYQISSTLIGSPDTGYQVFASIQMYIPKQWIALNARAARPRWLAT